jgi:choline dehydrogenase-like flavoprotein
VSTDLLARRADLVEHADVCVIGSGGGGAVAAAELARGGRSVVVLEQGHHWTRSDFTQREDEMLPRLFEEAGMRQTSDGSVTVLQGRCVGGSTVHNLCYAFRDPAALAGSSRPRLPHGGLSRALLRPRREAPQGQADP